MKQRDDYFYLLIMCERMEQLNKILSGRNKQDLIEDMTLQFAVLHLLETIGEASMHLSDGAKKSYPKVFWGQVRGLRNRIAHEYFEINLQIIWDSAKKNIPQLQKTVQRLLKRFSRVDL